MVLPHNTEYVKGKQAQLMSQRRQGPLSSHLCTVTHNTTENKMLAIFSTFKLIAL